MGVSTDLCASGGDVWVQYGWGKFDCIHCKCSCGRRRALPCAAAVLSESGNASHREGKRWPCLTLQRKQLYQRLITGRSKVRLFHNFSFIWPVACISANMSPHLNNYVRIRVVIERNVGKTIWILSSFEDKKTCYNYPRLVHLPGTHCDRATVINKSHKVVHAQWLSQQWCSSTLPFTNCSSAGLHPVFIGLKLYTILMFQGGCVER